MSVVDELKMNGMIEMNAMLQFSQPVKAEDTEVSELDKSEMVFSYMNMIAYNRKADLKLN